MAFLWMDSFDHYNTALIPAKYATNGGSPTIQAAGGRRASQCIRLPAATATITTAITPSGTTAVVGIAFKVNALAAGELLTIMDGATAQMCVCLKADGALEVRRGTVAGTVLGTSSSAGIISTGTYYFLELLALISTTVGTATVRLNGTNVTGLVLTGLNNAGSGVGQWTNLKLIGNASISELDYDDCYLCDGSGSAPLNTFLGDIRVDVRMPTADGATAEWTPSTGSDNYAMVDEIPPDGDTTYNSTTVVDNIDTFTVEDAPVVGATILAVQQCTYVKKSDSGTTTIAAVVRSGGTDYDQDNYNPTTSYAFAVQAIPEDPDTSAAWVEADFNAAEFGYKRVA